MWKGFVLIMSLSTETSQNTLNIAAICTMQRAETPSPLSALQKNYNNATGTTNDAWKNFARTLVEQEKVKGKKEALKRQIKDLNHEEEHLEQYGIKYKKVHEVSKAKVQELGTLLGQLSNAKEDSAAKK